MSQDWCIKLGSTWNDLKDDGTYDPHPLQGRIFEIPHLVPATGPRNPSYRLNEQMMKVMLVRNVSGAALLGARVLTLETGANGIRCVDSVDGYANVVNTAHCVLSDPYLPTAGVPDKHLFLVVISGPTYVRLSGTEADSNGDWVRGDYFISAATGTSATDTDGGRISHYAVGAPADAAAAATMAITSVNNTLGWVLEAKDAADDAGGLILVQACVRSFL
jgi:hypothetical protein